MARLPRRRPPRHRRGAARPAQGVRPSWVRVATVRAVGTHRRVPCRRSNRSASATCDPLESPATAAASPARTRAITRRPGRPRRRAVSTRPPRQRTRLGEMAGGGFRQPHSRPQMHRLDVVTGAAAQEPADFPEMISASTSPSIPARSGAATVRSPRRNDPRRRASTTGRGRCRLGCGPDNPGNSGRILGRARVPASSATARDSSKTPATASQSSRPVFHPPTARPGLRRRSARPRSAHLLRRRRPSR